MILTKLTGLLGPIVANASSATDHLWFSKDTIDGLKSVPYDILIPTLAAVILGAIFYMGLIFVIIKLGISLYRYFTTESDYMAKAQYKNDIMETLQSTIMFIVFLVVFIVVAALIFPTHKSTIYKFWNIVQNVLKLLNVGSWGSIS